MEHSDWYPLRGDGSALFGRSFFGEPELDRQLAAQPEVFWRSDGERRMLAFPWEPDRPFPLPELFCLCRIGEARGRRCVILEYGARQSSIAKQNGSG